MNERIIISLTSWRPRLGNLPIVLDSIFNQTLLPDLVVLNLADDEVLPDKIQEYLDAHKVEINRVPDTRVYKKLIPTVKKYPNDVVISIDDDFLYPLGMIQDFWNIHQQYPDFPVSGNRIVAFGMQGHCGCASLTKASYFGVYLDYIDSELIENCPSDDTVYAFFATMNGHPYIRTVNEYYLNMESVYPVEPYSDDCQWEKIKQSFLYLQKRFGAISPQSSRYFSDKYWSELIKDIETNIVASQRMFDNDIIKGSMSYRLGHAILYPFSFLKNRILWR